MTAFDFDCRDTYGEIDAFAMDPDGGMVPLPFQDALRAIMKGETTLVLLARPEPAEEGGAE